MGITRPMSLGDTTPPNPNPKNFDVLGVTAFDDNMHVVLVKYPDCTIEAQHKILVVEYVGDIRNLHTLDPHIAANQPANVVARFENTQNGNEMARLVASKWRK